MVEINVDAWGRSVNTIEKSSVSANGSLVNHRAYSGMPDDIREKLGLLSEEFRATATNRDYKAQWWASLSVHQRTYFCALAGVDHQSDFSARSWQSMTDDTRDTLTNEARQWARVLAPMRSVW